MLKNAKLSAVPHPDGADARAAVPETFQQPAGLSIPLPDLDGQVAQHVLRTGSVQAWVPV